MRADGSGRARISRSTIDRLVFTASAPVRRAARPASSQPGHHPLAGTRGLRTRHRSQPLMIAVSETLVAPAPVRDPEPRFRDRLQVNTEAAQSGRGGRVGLYAGESS
ncbi:hypothetical protein STRTUCAR8_03287 [Streptomyces turgidiscabies Car8]|uniref:Uncharacterized protein n=1 Tax=Streptomyces turgidiscabies (strain Car8) TaxID=698760 RepID=L7F2K4_STRT8|nr:hypothetical protein STRTUCAR8_03287 [Streptomyces turgidiscabies Car8]